MFLMSTVTILKETINIFCIPLFVSHGSMKSVLSGKDLVKMKQFQIVLRIYGHLKFALKLFLQFLEEVLWPVMEIVEKSVTVKSYCFNACFIYKQIWIREQLIFIICFALKDLWSRERVFTQTILLLYFFIFELQVQWKEKLFLCPTH